MPFNWSLRRASMADEAGETTVSVSEALGYRPHKCVAPLRTAKRV